MTTYAALITLLQPALHSVFGFVDSLNLAMFELQHRALQNTCYNGWLLSCFCSSLFCFTPDSTIIWCTLNYQGSWADGDLANHLDFL